MSRITWIASYPKSGNTWVRAIVDRIVHPERPLDLNALGSTAPSFARLTEKFVARHGIGLSGFGFRTTLGAKMPAPPVPSFTQIDFGALSRIDVIGPILFFYLAFGLVKPRIVEQAGTGMELLEIGVKHQEFIGRRLGELAAALPAGVQIVALLGRTSATAQDGPSDPWVWIGHQ